MPEVACRYCRSRYHAECFAGAGCVDAGCADPLFADEARLPAPIRVQVPAMPATLAPKASCPRRLVAFMVDTGVALSAWVACAAPAAAIGLDKPEVKLVAWLGMLTVAVFNEVVLTGLRGSSLGKGAVGIRVAREDGSNPGIFRAFLREVPGKFLSQVTWGLGFLMAAVDPQSRALHDRFSGTWVVDTERPAIPGRG